MEDYDETQCAEWVARGLIQVPANARITRSSFSLESVEDVCRDDVQLMANVITECAHKIARKHQDVKATLVKVEEDVGSPKTTLRAFVVYVEMPPSVTVDSQQLMAIHFLSPRLICDPIRFAHRPASLVEQKPEHTSLEVRIYSHRNPLLPEDIWITQTTIKCRRFVVHEPPSAGGDSGALKRSRASADQGRTETKKTKRH